MQRHPRHARASALILTSAVMLAAPASAGSAAPRDQVPSRTVKGTARTDGSLTPGAREVLVIRSMPARLPVQVVVGPSFDATECADPYFCEPSFAKRWPGAQRFRTSRRGRARLVFRMPSGYVRRGFAGISPDAFFSFAEGESVRIQVNGFTVGSESTTTGIAVGRARIDFPG